MQVKSDPKVNPLENGTSRLLQVEPDKAVRLVPATFLILERERTHPQAVSSSCFMVDSQRTGTFGSALPFRSHFNSPGILRPAVATLQDGQLMPRKAGEAVGLRTTANSRPRSNLYP